MSVKAQLKKANKQKGWIGGGHWITAHGHAFFIPEDKWKPPNEGKSGKTAPVPKGTVKSYGSVDENHAVQDMMAGGREAKHVAYSERGKVKARIVSTISRKAKVKPAEVQEYLDGWAETAGDHEEVPVQRQLLASKFLGLPKATMKHLPQKFLVMPTGKPPSDYNPTYDDTILDPAKERRMFNAEYAQTQAALKKQGIKYLTLFRGLRTVHGGTGIDFKSHLLQPLSSWSSDPSVALHDFGYGGEVHIIRVPASKVQSTAMTGRGCLSEAEVVLRGGRVKTLRVPSKVISSVHKKLKLPVKYKKGESLWATSARQESQVLYSFLKKK